jgi:hypothetical protein
VLLALELLPGQAPQDVILRVNSLGDELTITTPSLLTQILGAGIAAGAGPYLAVILFPIWFPMLVYDGFFRAQAPPFDGCCFVWIADVATGQAIAGDAPEGMTFVLPETRPTAPWRLATRTARLNSKSSDRRDSGTFGNRSLTVDDSHRALTS